MVAAPGDDGGDRQPEPALGPVRQVGPQPARQMPGQRRHDDLVELVIGECLLDRLQRVGSSQITFGGDAQRTQLRQQLTELPPGLGGRRLIASRASVVRSPPRHAGLQDISGRGYARVVRRRGVRDEQVERTRLRVGPLAELIA